jgi:hypothetical protein
MELQLELMLSIIDFLPHDDIRQFSLTAKWVRRLIAPTLFETITFHHPDRELSYWNMSTVLFRYLKKCHRSIHSYLITFKLSSFKY